MIEARAPRTPIVDLTPFPFWFSAMTHRNEQNAGDVVPGVSTQRRLVRLVRLDGELDLDLVADDEAAVLQRAAEGDPEVTTVELGASLRIP